MKGLISDLNKYEQYLIELKDKMEQANDMMNHIINTYDIDDRSKLSKEVNDKMNKINKIADEIENIYFG